MAGQNIMPLHSQALPSARTSAPSTDLALQDPTEVNDLLINNWVLITELSKFLDYACRVVSECADNLQRGIFPFTVTVPYKTIELNY